MQIHNTSGMRASFAAAGCFALLLSAGAARAVELVDQRQDSIDVAAPPMKIGGQSEQRLGQVVSAGVIGELTAVNLPVACTAGATLTIQIRDSLSGLVLASASFAGSSLPAFPIGTAAFRRFGFSSPAVLAAGDTFAIEMSATGDDGCAINQSAASASYSGGRAYFAGSPDFSWTPIGTFDPVRDDFPFQTVMNVTMRTNMQLRRKLDQSQTNIDGSVGGLAIGGQSEQRLAQTVTARRVGLLEAVRLPVACDEGTTLRVAIQGVAADGTPNGTDLAVREIPASALPQFGLGGASFRTIRFPSPVSVTIGTRFAIVLTRPDGEPTCGIFQGPVADSYPRGRAYYRGVDPVYGDSGWIPNAPTPATGRDDLPFQTLVD